MIQYQKLLSDIIEKGTLKQASRENMPKTLSLFGYSTRYDLSCGFPLVTTKKVSFKNIVVELLWFLKGDTNIKYLIDNGCNIWNEDAYNYYVKLASGNSSNWNHVMRDNNDGTLSMYTFEEFIEIIKICEGKPKLVSRDSSYTLGDCGKQYGWLWRNWSKFNYYIDSEMEINEVLEVNPIDQLKELITGLKNNPMSRRHIITAWNPATLDDMALHACHAFVQFNCRPINKKHWFGTELYMNEDNPKYYLDCQLYQRSADAFLGVPYNIASYALLTEILSRICNMVPGEFIHTFGDVHLYENHIEQAKEQLLRSPKPLPKLVINEPVDGVWDFDEMVKYIEISDFKLENYDPYPTIKAKLSTGLN